MESPAVRVLLFADLRRLAGSAELELRLSDPVSAGVIWERLCADHAGLRGLTETVRPALNRAYVQWGTMVSPGDELAFIPPVSGGSDDDTGELVRVGPEAIDMAGLTARASLRGIGAIATFVGVVRDPDQGRAVPALTYEAYPEMAEPVLRQIAQEARQRFSADQVLIQHRTGVVEAGAASVGVVVVSAHREQALQACAYAIDELKSRAPIWKSEG